MMMLGGERLEQQEEEEKSFVRCLGQTTTMSVSVVHKDFFPISIEA